MEGMELTPREKRKSELLGIMQNLCDTLQNYRNENRTSLSDELNPNPDQSGEPGNQGEVDLSEIQQKLVTKEYEDIEEMQTDMEVLVSNVKSIHQDKSQECVSAKEMLDLFLETKQRPLESVDETGEDVQKQRPSELVEETTEDVLEEIEKSLRKRGRPKKSESVPKPKVVDIVELGPRIRKCRLPPSNATIVIDTPAAQKESDSNSNDESGDDLEESDDPCWQFFKAMRYYTDSDGVRLAETFLKLPSKRYSPKYYKIVRKPLSLFRIRKNLMNGMYDTICEIGEDFDRLCENARMANRMDTDTYWRAFKLQRFMQKKMIEMLNIQHQYEESEADCADESSTECIPAEKLLERTLCALCQRLFDCETPEGRRPMLSFIEKPSEKRHPTYYQIIEKPIDLLTINSNIRASMYSSIEELISDFKLMFSNSKKYYSAESTHYRDAQALEKMLNEEIDAIVGKPSVEAVFVKTELADVMVEGSTDYSEDVAVTTSATSPIHMKRKATDIPKHKPISGFIMYSVEARKTLAAHSPNLTFGELSRHVGAEWKKLSAEEKTAWEQKGVREAAEKARVRPCDTITVAPPDQLDIMQNLYDMMSNFRGGDGRLMCDNSNRPSKSGYHKWGLANVMGLSEIQRKLRTKEYEEVEQLQADMDQLVRSAKSFYVDVLKLRKMMQNKIHEVVLQCADSDELSAKRFKTVDPLYVESDESSAKRSKAVDPLRMDHDREPSSIVDGIPPLNILNSIKVEQPNVEAEKRVTTVCSSDVGLPNPPNGTIDAQNKEAGNNGPKWCKQVNSYILYCAEMRKAVKLAHPNSSFAEISRIVGNSWKHLPDHERSLWEQKATCLNEQVLSNMKRGTVTTPAVQIHPRPILPPLQIHPPPITVPDPTQELNPSNSQFEEGIDITEHVVVDQKGNISFNEISSDKGPTSSDSLKERLYSFCQRLLNYETEDGRHPITMFVEKPSKELCPKYYEVIKEPIDLLTIQNNIIMNKYAAEEELLNDFKLMFRNCREYHGEESSVYRDAIILEKLVMDHAREMNESPNRVNAVKEELPDVIVGDTIFFDVPIVRPNDFLASNVPNDTAFPVNIVSSTVLRRKGRMNGYLLYSSQTRKVVAADHPNMSFGDVSRIVGGMWKNLSAHEKNEWEEKAVIISNETTLIEHNKPRRIASSAQARDMRQDLVYKCCWDGCDFIFEDQLDCLDHAIAFERGHVSSWFSKMPYPKEYQCQWKDCVRVQKELPPFPSLHRLIRHVREVHILKGGLVLSPNERTEYMERENYFHRRFMYLCN